jgi:2'-5' RNA ligase
MDRRVVVAFPRIDSAIEWQRVLAVRDRYDPLAGQIAPHLTLVFPFEDALPDAALEHHLRTVVAGLPPFPIVLRGITAHENEYLFLNVKQGNDALVGLHDALYSGVLAAHHRRDHTFVPHITVGRLPAQQLPAALEATADVTAPIEGQVEGLSVYRIDPDRPVILRVPLGG